MKAVIYYFPTHDNFINGSFFYILDYYLYLITECKENIYFIGVAESDYRPYIFDLIKTRYTLIIPSNNFIFLQVNYTNTQNHAPNLNKIYHQLLSFRIDISLTNVETMRFLNGVLPSKQVLIQGTHYTTAIKDIINLNRENYKIFEENNNYKKKLYMKRVKRPQHVATNTGFVNLKGLRYINDEEFKQYIIPYYDNLNKLYVFGDKNLKYKYKYLSSYSNIQVLYDNPLNLFELFDTYIDITLHTFDYSPRMLIESAWFNKKIVYIDTGKEDGAKIRYNDIINNDWKKYILNSEDEIIKEMIRRW